MTSGVPMGKLLHLPESQDSSTGKGQDGDACLVGLRLRITSVCESIYHKACRAAAVTFSTWQPC